MKKTKNVVNYLVKYDLRVLNTFCEILNPIFKINFAFLYF